MLPLPELSPAEIRFYAQQPRQSNFIRMLAEFFVPERSTSIITPADFSIDDDECGVTRLDSFATSLTQGPPEKHKN